MGKVVALVLNLSWEWNISKETFGSMTEPLGHKSLDLETGLG